MKRELVLALGIFILGIPTTTPAHTGNSSVADDSSVQFTATIDGVIQFGNRQNNQLSNESMTLVFDDDIGRADDNPGADDVSNSGSNVTDDTDVDNVVQFKKMIPLPESMAGGLNDAGVIRGVQPGGRAWKLTGAEGQLKEDGELKVSVEGLLLEGEDMNTSSASFRALVSCVGEAGETTFTTPDFPVDELGNAQIEHRFDDMGLCIAPTVFVGSGSDAALGAEGMNDLTTSDFRWFAVTGHSFGGTTPSQATDDSNGATPIAAGSGAVLSNGVPPLSDVFSGTQSPPANGFQPATGATATPPGGTPPVTGAAASPGASANAAGGAVVPPVNETPPVAATSPAGVPPLNRVAPGSRPGTPTTSSTGLAFPPVAGTGAVVTAPPVTAPSPIITAPPAPATSPIIQGLPNAGTLSAPGSFDDAFPNSTFDDPIPAPGFTTAPGFPLSSGAFDDPGPFRFGGDFTDLALASPVF